MLSPEQYTQATRAIQTNSLHSVPRFATSLLPRCCPLVHPQITSLIYWDRKHFTRTPHLTTQHLKLSVSDPSWGSQHIHVHTASLLLSWITTPVTKLEIKYSASIRQLLFTRKEYICVKYTFPDLDEIPHICFCEHNWFQQRYGKSCHQTFLIMHLYQYKNTPNTYVFIYKLNICTTLLIHSIYITTYKTRN